MVPCSTIGTVLLVVPWCFVGCEGQLAGQVEDSTADDLHVHTAVLQGHHRVAGG